MKGIIGQNLACLDQALELLPELTGEGFQRKESRAYGSSIGDHFRHTIEHYTALREGVATGRVDYEGRRRDEAMSTDPGAAREALESHCAFLETLAEAGDRELRVVSDHPDDPESQSSLSRELNFVLSHTVHHFALIALICAARDIPTPKDFGMAPSTLRYQATQR